MRQKSKVIIIYLFSAIIIMGWVAAIFLAPYLRSRDLPGSILIYSLFSPICHQNPARSFFICGYQLAVCSRCLGIYAGFLGGIVIYPFLRGFSAVYLPRTKYFIAMSLPIGLDTLGNFFRLWNTSNWPRFSLGFVWGLILPFYLITGLAELFTTDTGLKMKKYFLKSKYKSP